MHVGAFLFSAREGFESFAHFAFRQKRQSVRYCQLHFLPFPSLLICAQTDATPKGWKKEKQRNAEQTKEEESTSEKIHEKQEIAATVFEPRMHPAMNACTKANRMRVSASEHDYRDNGPIKAEAMAREFIRKKHFRLKRIFFKTLRQENNIWCLEGIVSSGLIFTTARNFKLNIECENWEILSFEETHIKTRANTHF